MEVQGILWWIFRENGKENGRPNIPEHQDWHGGGDHKVVTLYSER